MTSSDCVWPSGNDKPVCLIKFGHREFHEKTGVNFENGVDDLDEYFGGFLIDSDLGPIKLLEYVNAPIRGISIYVDSLLKTSDAMKVIRKKFNLADEDVLWVREIED
ncbi:hypothetical protein [Burkholderia stagnalis]|uniref:hypothetical protein n=1 Tax=Burkholderia stagnalis TaxID=1503054 RepID=UPI000AC648FA|nr:hypothetical protein [Burkholderia stagnalis]